MQSKQLRFSFGVVKIWPLAIYLICQLLWSWPAWSAQLFPPQNSYGQASCPDGKVLSWTDDGVWCADPTPGINVSCPEGGLLTGISNGVPNCTTIPTCAPDQVLSSSGARFSCKTMRAAIGSCYWQAVPFGLRNWTCAHPNDVVMGIGYEDAEWTDATDNQSYPEVNQLLCCQLSIVTD